MICFIALTKTCENVSAGLLQLNGMTMLHETQGFFHTKFVHHVIDVG